MEEPDALQWNMHTPIRVRKIRKVVEKGKAMETLQSRRAHRTPVNLEVDVETVLERHRGRITDLSENGAKIEGDPFQVGQKIKLTAEQGVMWAKVRWAEADRCGVEFETPMPEQFRRFLDSQGAANDRARRVFGRKVA